MQKAINTNETYLGARHQNVDHVLDAMTIGTIKKFLVEKDAQAAQGDGSAEAGGLTLAGADENLQDIFLGKQRRQQLTIKPTTPRTTNLKILIRCQLWTRHR